MSKTKPLNQNKMKQTAVEWLVEQICWDHIHEWKNEIEQAKQMEKEQIIDAYEEQNVKWEPEFYEDGTMSITNKFRDAEQYYNETFKSE